MQGLNGGGAAAVVPPNQTTIFIHGSMQGLTDDVTTRYHSNLHTLCDYEHYEDNTTDNLLTSNHIKNNKLATVDTHRERE